MIFGSQVIKYPFLICTKVLYGLDTLKQVTCGSF